MTEHVTVANVRSLSGAPESLVSNDDVTHAIQMVQFEMEKILNMKLDPTLVIDILDGNGKDNIFTTKNPLLAVRALKIDETSEDVSALHIYPGSGQIRLGENSTAGVFIRKARAILVKYYHAWQEETTTQTASTAATTAGTAVAISVASHVGFSADDWVYVYGMDGKKEAAKVSTASGNVITVDELIFSHESGSIVTLLDVPGYLKRLIEVEAALYVAINAIGVTYSYAASYTVKDFSITKGVPYTHWRESVEKLIKERTFLKSKIQPRTAIYVD